jgi:subtilase family serine protease
MAVRPLRILTVTVFAVALTTVGIGSATAVNRSPSFAALPNSVPKTTDHVTGSFKSKTMSIEVALAPRNAAGLAAVLRSTYTRGSGSYHHWLAKGQFTRQYAPTAATRKAVADYLRDAGLTVHKASNKFLVRASGSSAKISAAFRTSLKTYRGNSGTTYHANSTAVHVPTTLASRVLGVIGLSNTVRLHSMIQRAPNTYKAHRSNTAKKASTPDCETGYPTKAQFANSLLGISGYPFGYGGAPGCNGLTPAQTNSLYGAPHGGPRVKGAGVNMAVFELSSYQHSDIATYGHTFFGNSYTPPLVDVNIDGGPLAPICPVGDQCPPQFEGYSGDIEVVADIETQLAIAPDVRNLIVYNAPNDFTGQTELDEWTAIANANQAAVVSSSWGLCENDAGAAYAQAENVLFEQMALQGQSVFGGSGDTGAFSCIRSDGTTIVNLVDPPSQPWVTSVGGTSFESDNPGHNVHPAYPNGVETVWNPYNACNTSGPDAFGLSGFDWCAGGGAGGGGASQFWGRPIYQFGRGVNNPLTTHANGTTQCSLASTGTPCRETPDISANADENTPYAEFCTGNANTPFSVCGQFSQFQTPPGWFGIGGTSLSSPVWSAIIADRDSFQGFRSGNVNPLLYLLFNLAPNTYFHDITGKGQAVNNNGLYPTTPGYDEATGIGTPRMAAIITRTF